MLAEISWWKARLSFFGIKGLHISTHYRFLKEEKKKSNFKVYALSDSGCDAESLGSFLVVINITQARKVRFSCVTCSLQQTRAMHERCRFLTHSKTSIDYGCCFEIDCSPSISHRQSTRNRHISKTTTWNNWENFILLYAYLYITSSAYVTNIISSSYKIYIYTECSAPIYIKSINFWSTLIELDFKLKFLFDIIFA